MCLICEIDPQKSEAFGDNLMNVLNQSAQALLLSIGHRTGLFDYMDEQDFADSDKIAGASGLNERYVREWLKGMAAAKVLETDETGEKFKLPGEHAAFLTRRAGGDNIGIFAQYISVLGSVESRIIDCFKNGGGVPYEAYDRFHEVMAEDSGQSVLSSLISDIVPLIPRGIKKLEAGIKVLDVGCGSGRALNLLARRFPNSEFTGIDLCYEPLEKARAEADKHGLKNIRFIQGDLTTYPIETQFDLITAFDAIHDQARPDVVLSKIASNLKSDGYFLMQDIDSHSNVRENMEHPIGTLLYTISLMHCMTVSLAQGGMGLGAMWGTDTALSMLQTAGFDQVAVHRLEHDFQNCYFVIQK